MISKEHMMDCVYHQLAIDYNCSPDDFRKDGLIFTHAFKNKDRRPFPWVTPRLEIITMGHSVVINATDDIMPFVRSQLEDKTRDEVFSMPFVLGANPYFLPDIGTITSFVYPDGFQYEMVERQSISSLYEIGGFYHALQYNIDSPHPEMLVVLAKYKDEIVGMSGASADSKTMWQIGVNILPPYQGKGLAAALVNMLTLEILNRGYVPYYFTSDSNVLSMHVAIRAGYIPAWVHCYKTRLEDFKIDY